MAPTIQSHTKRKRTQRKQVAVPPKSESRTPVPSSERKERRPLSHHAPPKRTPPKKRMTSSHDPCVARPPDAHGRRGWGSSHVRDVTPAGRPASLACLGAKHAGVRARPAPHTPHHTPAPAAPRALSERASRDVVRRGPAECAPESGNWQVARCEGLTQKRRCIFTHARRRVSVRARAVGLRRPHIARPPRALPSVTPGD